jgi:tryptophan 2-monooxygenase
VVSKQAAAQRIAVIGAGIAGTTAARELVRCGFTNVHLFEATERIGGRFYSRPINKRNLGGTPATYELGAMRISFFPKPGSNNSLTDYYVSLFDIKTQDFPNPGAPGVTTAVYMNDGLGPNPRSLAVNPIIFTNKEGLPHKINDPVLQSVEAKWQDFKRRARSVFRQEYYRQDLVSGPEAERGSPRRLSNWQLFWRKVERKYWRIDFRDLVTMPGTIDPERPWDFGGMGMNRLEADVFATIGAGDGGWGPFYDVSALWVIRTLLFGYADDLQLVIGKTQAGTGPLACRFKVIRRKHEENLPTLRDTRGGTFSHPIFLGIQSLAECMLFDTLGSQCSRTSYFDLACGDTGKRSPCEAGIGLFMSTEITRLERVITEQVEKFRLTFAYDGDATQSYSADYDYVIMTAPAWALQQLVTMDLGPKILPKEITKTLNSSHWIASKKVFFPLQARFWNPARPIPQVWVSDNVLQGVYAYKVRHDSVPEAETDHGAILISYTWEDDALKLLAYRDEELKRKCIEQFDRMLKDFQIGVTARDIIQTTERDGVTDIDYESGFVFEWLQQRAGARSSTGQ